MQPYEAANLAVDYFRVPRMNKMLYKYEIKGLKVTNMCRFVHMLKLKGDSGNVRRSIDLCLSNKQEFKQTNRDSQCIICY